MDTRTIDLLGLYDVHRWNVVKTMRYQSVAEHSFGVAVIAAELTNRLGLDAPSMLDVLSWALAHDAPETLSGDIDGKFKREFPSVRAAVVEAERGAFPWYKEMADKVPPHINALVKVADKLETIHYIRTWGHGSRADDVMRELTAIIYAESVPNLDDAMAEAELSDGTSCVYLVRDILNQSLLESNSIQFRKIGG